MKRVQSALDLYLKKRKEKNMRKKIFSLVMACCIVFSLFAVCVVGTSADNVSPAGNDTSYGLTCSTPKWHDIINLINKWGE